MSTTKGFTLTPTQEGFLYAIGLFLLYIASYAPPIGVPATVRTVFTLLGAFAIVIKFELAQQPKPQIPANQAVYSVIVVFLSVAGGQVSAYFGGYWWAGLVVAIIGAIIAVYEDLGGQVPTTTSPVVQTPPAPTPAVGAPAVPKV